MKQRVLADWHIPPTDKRLGKMNTARWIMAHQMILDGERRTVRRIARILGTDMDALEDDDEKKPKEYKFGDTPKVMPLAALLNPEVYKNFIETDHTSPIEDSVTDDAYEQQVKKLENAGLLTEIDFLSEEAEKKVKDKKKESSFVKEMDDEEWNKLK